MIAAADVTLLKPCGMNGWRFPGLKWIREITMKKVSTTSLTATMTRFAPALSRAPRTSRNVIATTMNTAGRLKTPPSDGDLEIATGSWTPNAASRNALTLPPQATATAATDRPYSRIRSQPMIHATSSPMVARGEECGVPGPADEPRDELAHGRVGVGVRAAGHRDRRREFGVRQGGERARDRRED